MRQQVRSAVAGVRLRLFVPMTVRFDQVDRRLDAIDACLVRLSQRVDEIESIMQTTGARASALTERSLGITESSVRIERRVEEIERLLGAPAAER